MQQNKAVATGPKQVSAPSQPASSAQKAAAPGPAKAPENPPVAYNLPTSRADQTKPNLNAQGDKELENLATKLKDLYVDHPPIFNTISQLGEIALSNLRAITPPLDVRRFRQVLKLLREDVRHEFFRSTRNPALNKYLQALGVSWEEMYKEDPPTSADWLEFAKGSIGGFGFGMLQNELGLIQMIHTLVNAIYITVGQFWDPEKAEKFDNFTAALGQLIKHPIASAGTIAEEKRKEIEKELMNRQYQKAGFLFGQIAMDLIALKDLGRLGIRLAKSLPKVTLATIRKAQLLREYARFFISTKTTGHLPDGNRIQKLENMIVISSAKGEKSVLDVSALAGEEKLEWDLAVSREKKIDSPHPESKPQSPKTDPTGIDTNGRPFEFDRSNDRLVNGEPRTKSRTGRETNHKPETKSITDRGTSERPGTKSTPDRGTPGSLQDDRLHKALRQAESELREFAKEDIAYKAEREAKGLSQKGGKWFKLRYNREEKVAALKRLIANPKLIILEQAEAFALVFPNGSKKLLSEMGFKVREWDWAELGDGNRWRLTEAKTTEEIFGSIEGGIKRPNLPIEGRYISTSKLGKQLKKADQIFEEMERTGTKLEVRGTNLRSGKSEKILLGADEIYVSVVGYHVTAIH